MNSLTRTLSTLLIASFTSTAWAQDVNMDTLQSIVPGKANPIDAASFTPQDIAPRAGQFKIVLNIWLQTYIPSHQPVTCSASITLDGANVTWVETSFVRGSRRGSSASCVINMPYSWDSANVNGQLRLVTVASTGSTVLRTRNAHMVRLLPVPANNTTTTYTYNVRL